MSTSTLASSTVTEFAHAVRIALADLGPDEIDDLTDGLEADLTDRLTESGAPDLGDPAAYAEELRAAAGLPHRSATRPGFASGLAGLRDAPKVLATAVREVTEAHPALRRVHDFVVTLRPLWWLFRAVVVTALIINVTRPGWWTPINGLNVLIGLAVLVVSVQFGRGRWLPFAWMRGLLLAVNLILVISTPFLAAAAVNTVNGTWYQATYSDESGADMSSTGLLENGNPVSNVFAYDAQGKPLTDVQLFDQDGKPLNLAGDPSAPFIDAATSGFLTVPSAEVPGRLGWNVFPMDQVKDTAVSNDGTIKPTAHRIPADPPFAMAKPLAGSEAQGSSTPEPTPTPTPTP